jgi:hypothetical protein
MEPIQRPFLFLKKRKFLLPGGLLVLALLAVIYFLSGYREPAPQKTSRLNTRLPDAQFKKAKEKSKMTLYEEMARDSAGILEKMQQDPFYLISRHDSDVAANQVLEKLEKFKTIIHQKAADPPVEPLAETQTPSKPELENPKSSHDLSHHPELDQLSGMLDKVMAIQHPEILQDSLARFAAAHQPFSYAVEKNQPAGTISAFGNQNEKSNRFYDLAAEKETDKKLDQAMEAEVSETQTLVSGATIKIRLLNEVRINGQVLAKDQFIYGTARLNSERLQVQFSSIRCGNQILPVSLEVYDLDGLDGIYIPGSMNREVMKNSGDQVINTLGLTSIDPSLGAQAAGAGIQAAKSLITQKIKLVRVTLPAGYRLLLKDSKK